MNNLDHPIFKETHLLSYLKKKHLFTLNTISSSDTAIYLLTTTNYYYYQNKYLKDFNLSDIVNSITKDNHINQFIKAELINDNKAVVLTISKDKIDLFTIYLKLIKDILDC
jgi:hypothetical protein